MLLRLASALATLFLTLLFVADTGAGISRCSSHAASVPVWAFSRILALALLLRAWALAALQSHSSYCVDPALCTLPVVPCFPGPQQAYWASCVSLECCKECCFYLFLLFVFLGFCSARVCLRLCSRQAMWET